MLMHQLSRNQDRKVLQVGMDDHFTYHATIMFSHKIANIKLWEE